MHRALRVLSTALITAGLVILADVGITLAWQEPLSSLYGSIQQGQAEDELEEVEADFPSDELLARAANAKTITQQARILAAAFEAELEPGKPIGRIRIPRIGLDVVTIEGIDTQSLRKGPGHYTPAPDREFRLQGDGSALPGQGRTIGIAGHRTTYLAPFRRLDELKKDDKVILEMPYASFVYEVQTTKIVGPLDIEVVRNVAYERLVLTACHPLYSAAQRIVTFAKLEEISLFGSGEQIWQDP